MAGSQSSPEAKPTRCWRLNRTLPWSLAKAAMPAPGARPAIMITLAVTSVSDLLVVPLTCEED
jgi:hypothetical protein